jgi:hypothetical protein
MKDLYKNPISGHIIIECLNEVGSVIDRFEKHNLIMDTARTSVSELTCGLVTAEPLNKFVLGTEGHTTGDILTPKTDLEGFVSSRTELFSEELSSYTYPIEFSNPGSASGTCAIISEPDSGVATSTINLEYLNNDIKYTIEIPELAANDSGIVAFTEAALYAGNNIFSMKCFPGKIKDSTVSLRVIWVIKF